MIDWAERAVCILLSLCILANALLVRRLVQAWSFPAVLFSLAWFIYTIIPLVCFPEAHVYPAAMLYILGASAAVSLGGVSDWRVAFNRSRTEKTGHEDYYAGKMLLIIFIICFILTVAGLLLNSVSQGISINQLVSNINDSAAEYAGRRYAYDIEPNIYQQVSNVLAYFCAGLGGLIVASYDNKPVKFLIVLGALFPAVFVMMSQSARGMLFLCAAIFYAGILVAAIQRNQFSLFSRRALPKILMGLVITIPLVTISFVARGVSSGAGQSFWQSIAPYWASYTSGHLFAFSDWLGNYIGAPSALSYDDPGMTGGFYTFMAFFRLFGDDRTVPLGVYGEYLFIPPYIGTNIYTAFRGLIHDFGIPGSIVAISLMSYLSHKSYKAIVVSSMPALSVAVVLFTVSFIYQSFIISALMWNTLIAGLSLVGIALYFYRFNYMARGYSSS
jgi:oligosaccharide repeat unit polymerase